MTAERHNAPQHNLHANHAGNVGDSTSGAHTRQPWRRLVRFFATTVLASFILNEIWEMARMSAYIETEGRSWANTLGLCTWAALGDVGIILGVYVASALAAADLCWGLRGGWKNYVTAAVLGAGLCGAGHRTLVVHCAHAGGVRA